MTVLARRPDAPSGRAGLTADWLDLGERAVTDTVAVLLAGAGDPATRIVAETVDEYDGPVLSLATGRRMSPRSAALVDGTSAHALDYDDVDDSLIAHPSAVLVPALLAAAQHRDLGGEAVLRAYRAGLRAAREIGRKLDIPRHYASGWHSTSTVGTLGAAAAVSDLLGLDGLAARHALGIAGSLACGSRQNFGTMTKPLHAGVAASNGLTAAYLAERGFTADPDQLDGPLGFLALHRAPGAEPVPVPTAPAEDDAPGGLNVKLFPCCYGTHAAIEAATRLHGSLRPQSDVSAVEVTAIEVTVQPGGLAPLIHHRPSDGTQAKFSMEYAVAAALLDGAITLASFEDERVRRADVQQLLRKVTMTEHAAHSGGSPWSATIAVRTVSGETRTAHVDSPIGHSSRPLSEQQLRDKFRDCLGMAGAGSVEAGLVETAYEGLRGLRRRPEVTTLVRDIGRAVPTEDVPK